MNHPAYREFDDRTLDTWQVNWADVIGKTAARKLVEVVRAARYAERRWGRAVDLPPWVHEAVAWVSQRAATPRN
jgi:hypothetical protein